MNSLSALTRALCVLGTIAVPGFAATREVALKRDIRRTDPVVQAAAKDERNIQPVELLQRIHDELPDIVKPNGDAVSNFSVGDATCYKPVARSGACRA
jgi:hypothetical protein